MGLESIEWSPIFKSLLVLLLSGLMPISAFSFVMVRRTKKEAEFARVVEVLGIARDEAEFARNRVTEQFAARDYRLPVLTAWLLSVIGFISLLFGADLVSEHVGKTNFILTSLFLFDGDKEAMQHLRLQSQVVMSLGFLGAFLWSAQNIIRRLNTGDLAPSVYFYSAIRLILAPVLSLMLALLIESTPAESTVETALPVIAFLVGFFPDEALLYLKERTPIFRSTSKTAAHALPLTMIEGINVFDRARLSELNIDDAQNLATANIIELVVRTPFSPNKIIDWIGQAKLYVYFKDCIVDFRSRQIRTIFDLCELAENEEMIKSLAQECDIDVMGLRHATDMAAKDPNVNQLLEFQNRLCCHPSDHP